MRLAFLSNNFAEPGPNRSKVGVGWGGDEPVSERRREEGVTAAPKINWETDSVGGAAEAGSPTRLV